MFDIIEHLSNVKIHYVCEICGKEVTQDFTDSPYYQNIKDDEDAVIDYVEAHLSFDSIDSLDIVPATIELYSALCGERECRRQQIRRNKEKMLELIKVPTLFKNVPPVDALHTEFSDKIGVIYTGDVGVGKTYRAVATLKRFILANGGPNKVSYKFMNVCEMFLNMQQEMRGLSSKSILKTCMEVDILVLDDLGTEKASEWTEPNIYVLLNHRIENMKHTIITSNIGKDEELEDKFNQRIASRLKLFKQKHLNGTDRRVAS